MGWQDDAVINEAPWAKDTIITPAPVAANSNSWFDEAKKYLPGFAQEQARRLGAGVLQTWNQGLKNFGTISLPSGAATAMPIVGPLLAGIHSLQGATTGDLQSTIDKLDVPPAPGGADEFLYNMMHAGGSALATPVGGIGSLVTSGGKTIIPFIAKQLTQNAVPAMMGSLGGTEARDLTGQLTSNPLLLNLADLTGNIVAGGPTAFATGPRQTRALAEVRRSVAGLTPADFTAAQTRAQQFRDAGATTATAAEAFGPNSMPMDLASKTRGSVLDNALRQVTTDRVPDLQNLGNTFLDRLGNPGGVVNPGDVSNTATDAANGILANLRNQRGQIIDARQAQMPPINPMYTADVQSQLHAMGDSVNQPNRAAAFHNMADALEGQNGFYTDPKELSLAIADQAAPFANPNAPQIPNRRISDLQSTQEAIDAARTLVDQHAPGFAANTYHFGNFSNDIITPFRQSPVGTLLDANPITARITDPGKLERMVSLAPTEVGDNARMLNDPAITGGATVSPLDIAAALSQRAIGDGPLSSSNPGAAVNNVISYPALHDLISAGGGDAAHTMAPLQAADSLQAFSTPASIAEMPQMSWAQAPIRLFRTVDMMMTGSNQATRQRQIAELLASRDPGAIGQLQQIGMFDPNVRRALALKTVLNPTLDGSVSPTEGQ